MNQTKSSSPHEIVKDVISRGEKSRDFFKMVIDNLFLPGCAFEEALKSNDCENAEFMKALSEDPSLAEYLNRRLCFEKLRIYAEYLKYLPNVFLKLLSLMNVEGEEPKTIRGICTDYLNLQKQFSEFGQPAGFDMKPMDDELPKKELTINPKTASKLLSLLAKDVPKKQTRISKIRFETDDPTEKPQPPPE